MTSRIKSNWSLIKSNAQMIPKKSQSQQGATTGCPCPRCHIWWVPSRCSLRQKVRLKNSKMSQRTFALMSFENQALWIHQVVAKPSLMQWWSETMHRKSQTPIATAIAVSLLQTTKQWSPQRQTSQTRMSESHLSARNHRRCLPRKWIVHCQTWSSKSFILARKKLMLSKLKSSIKFSLNHWTRNRITISCEAHLLIPTNWSLWTWNQCKWLQIIKHRVAEILSLHLLMCPRHYQRATSRWWWAIC